MDAPWVNQVSPAARAAETAIADARRRTVIKHYCQIACQLPAILHRHGLGQLLAYLKVQGGDRKASPYRVLAEQIDGWLLEATGVSARSALAAVTARDSGFCLEATEQTWLFLRALRDRLESHS